MTQKVVLDTDIGDDIDDALALGLILASPELELVGVATVFKNTLARARQARTVLQTAGRGEIPVAAGCGAVLSPRLEMGMDPRHAYLEGELPNQDAASLPDAQLPPLDPRHGVDFLIDTLLTGEVVPITIGAMTNLAMALAKEPRLVGRIPRIVAMAATFDRPVAEWNIACDPVAAALVMGSGIPMRIVGLDVTMRVQFRREHLDTLAACELPLARLLARSVVLWQRHCDWAGTVQAMPVMHDPLAVISLLQPDLLRWRKGTAHVELAGQHSYGFTLFRADASGPHEHAYDVDSEAALALWMERITHHGSTEEGIA